MMLTKTSGHLQLLLSSDSAIKKINQKNPKQKYPLLCELIR